MSAAAHRETARLALDNAQGMRDDARLLLETGCVARTLALSVIGLEEAGKALLYSFAVFGLASNVVEGFEEGSWKSPLSNHLFKLLAVDMIRAAYDELDYYEMAAAGELGPYSDHERTARLLCGCGRTLSDMFEEGGVAAGREWFKRMEAMLERFDRYETPHDEKMRGLYVDLGRSSGQPQDVTTVDGEMRLSTLESTLEILAYFGACLEDDGDWEELQEEVERVRSEYDPAE